MRRLHNSSLPRLDFEYQPRRRDARWAAWLLLLVAAAFAGDVGWSYVKVRRALDDRAAEAAFLQRKTRAQSDQPRPYQPKDAERELVFAQATIHKIALPWNDLFKALGSSTVDEISLLSIEPDAGAGTLEVTGEAKDFPALLTYVARLEANSYFRAVRLTRHEIRHNEPKRPVFFAIVAAWKTQP